MSTDHTPDAVAPVCGHCKLTMARHSTQAVEGHAPHQVTIYSCDKCGRMAPALPDPEFGYGCCSLMQRNCGWLLEPGERAQPLLLYALLLDEAVERM